MSFCVGYKKKKDKKIKLSIAFEIPCTAVNDIKKMNIKLKTICQV